MTIVRRVEIPTESSDLPGNGVIALAKGAIGLADALMLESKENYTAKEVGGSGPFDGSGAFESLIKVAIAGIPLYVGGTLHSPSTPAGPASTGTGRPFRSISATVTHQSVRMDISDGFAVDRAVTYGYP
jgi:hypothetical protein